MGILYGIPRERPDSDNFCWYALSTFCIFTSDKHLWRIYNNGEAGLVLSYYS